MKNLNKFIIEKLKLGKNNKVYNYHPNTRDELVNLLDKLIKERGNNADLNDIDVSKIDNMSFLFTFVHARFNGDISEWDVSEVKNMKFMFADCPDFNCDLSNWDVSKVEYMQQMFYNSNFSTDLSRWDVRNVKDMTDMFYGCPLEKNPPAWYKK